MAAITSAQSGNWSATTTWTGGVVPIEGDTVTIQDTHVVTIDQNITIGDDTTTAAINIAAGGKLELLSTAAADYILTLKGDLTVSGTLEIGTTTNPIPLARKFTIKTNYSATLADGKYGTKVLIGGTCTIQGAALSYDRALLAADAAAAATSLTTSVSTGWKAGDVIGIASTTQTYSQCEKGTLSVDADLTTLTITAGLTYAHSGTSPTQAEIINLTRNLLVTAYDTTAVGYVVFETTATVDIDWCEFSYLGENATDKYGVTAKTTTGSCNVQNCALHDFEDCGFYTTGSASDNITFSNNVTYGLASLAGDNVSIVATSGTAITLDNNVVMYSAYSSGRGYCIGDVGITFTNNIVTGTRSYGMLISESKVLSGTFSGNTSHSCATAGMNVANAKVGTISSTTIWRCAGGYAGIYMSTLSNIIFDGVTLFGNETGSLQFGGNVNLVFKNVVSNGDTTFATADGVKFSSTALNADILFENCDFGTASGIKTAHTNDINVNAVCYVTFTLINTILASPTEVANQANMFSGSYIKSQKHDQTAGLHKAWFPNGTMSIDTAIFDVTPSTRMTPIDAAEKLELPVAKFAVVNGATATVSVKVRESVVGDGTDYNGNRARLILKKNIAAGITADTVLATATVASEGAWETLSGTTTAPTDDAVLECAVDCDGTTGWLNVDTSGVT